MNKNEKLFSVPPCRISRPMNFKRLKKGQTLKDPTCKGYACIGHIQTEKATSTTSAVFSGGAGGARAPPEFGGSQKGQSLISAYQSLAITTNTPGFEKLNTALAARWRHSTLLPICPGKKTVSWFLQYMT